jgi:pSer/pThr/pTyr-binding forkhead associated (FHA) protein
VTHSGNDQTSHEAIVDAVSAFGANFLSGLDPSSPASAKDTVSELGWVPTGSAVLVVQRGLNAACLFWLDQQVTSAGRHPDSDIVLDNITVSRRHAEFRLEGDKFRIVDMGSLNGTYVNRQRIESAVLTNGDEIGIGKFRMVFLTRDGMTPCG